jgi:hypothetical protein
MHLCARGIVVACEGSCICVLGESLLLVSPNAMCARGIGVASEWSSICVLGESMLLVIDYVFVC